MKKTIILLVISLWATGTFAQQRQNRVKAMKIAFLTNELNLTEQEAEKFWPIYNRYEKELHRYRVVERKRLMDQLKEKGGVSAITEEEADGILEEFYQLKKKIGQLETERYEKLREVLSAKKMLKLYRAEERFKKRLLERLKKGRR